jgi:hypothetical protein
VPPESGAGSAGAGRADEAVAFMVQSLVGPAESCHVMNSGRVSGVASMQQHFLPRQINSGNTAR